MPFDSFPLIFDYYRILKQQFNADARPVTILFVIRFNFLFVLSLGGFSFLHFQISYFLTHHHFPKLNISIKKGLPELAALKGLKRSLLTFTSERRGLSLCTHTHAHSGAVDRQCV